MKKNNTERKASESRSLTGQAGQVAEGTLRVLENVPYTADATGLVIVLAKWIAENSDQPVLEARAYGGVLETLVEAMSNNVAARRGARDVAA
jgi:hypothetical protein